MTTELSNYRVLILIGQKMQNFFNYPQEVRLERMKKCLNEPPHFESKSKEELGTLFNQFEAVRLSNRARCIANLISYYQALGMCNIDIVFYLENLGKVSDKELLREYLNAKQWIGIESYDFNDDAS